MGIGTFPKKDIMPSKPCKLSSEIANVFGNNLLEQMKEQAADVSGYRSEIQDLLHDQRLYKGYALTLLEELYGLDKDMLAEYPVSGDVIEGNHYAHLSSGGMDVWVALTTGNYATPSAIYFDKLAVSVSGSGGGGAVEGRKTFYLSDYVSDPTNPLAVDKGMTTINGLLEDGCVVDLSGSYVWPNERLITTEFNNIHIRNGLFKRSAPNVGVEYIIWAYKSDGTKITGLTLDGASPGTTWGSQGIYVSQSTNTIIGNNYFKDIGDGVIRYAFNPGSGAVDHKVTTDGLVIVGNIFENCQQVTSNGTGAYNVIVTSNVFKNSAVKVTQRTQEKSGWTIITGNIFKGMHEDSPVTMQGGHNLILMDNIIEDCGGFFSFYPNHSPFVGDNVPSGNIHILRNKCKNLEGTYMIYGEVRGNKLPNSILPMLGDLVIQDNTFERVAGGNDVTAISLFCYVPGAYIARNVLIDGNEFVGNMKSAILFGSDGYMTIKEDGYLKITNNKGGTTYQAIKANINAETLGRGAVDISGNEFHSPQLLLINSTKSEGPFETMVVDNNKVFVKNSGGIFNSQINLSSVNKSPMALTTSCVNNKVYYLDGSGDGFIINMGLPRVSDVGNYTMVISGNIIAGPAMPNTVIPLYINSNSAATKEFVSFIFNNNVCELPSGNSGSLVHDPLMSVKRVTFISKSNPMVQLLRYSKELGEGNDYTIKREWTDGRVMQEGFRLLRYQAPYSGNVYLSPKPKDDRYMLHITPYGSDALGITIVSKDINGFSPGFKTMGGAQATPEFFYTASWDE